MGDRHEHSKDENQAPQGVGESTTRHGEDVVKEEGKEPGRYDTGKKGESQRPTGKSTPRDQPGITPSQTH